MGRCEKNQCGNSFLLLADSSSDFRAPSMILVSAIGGNGAEYFRALARHHVVEG